MRATSASSTHDLEKARVLAKAMVRAGAGLGLNGAQVADAIGRSPASVSRIVNGGASLRLDSKEAELSALLVRCYRSLDSLVGGNDSQRKAWMAAYNSALGAKPRDLVGTAQGLVRVVEYLDRMRAPN